MAKIAAVLCLVVMSMVVITPIAEAIITCTQVGNALRPCIGYATGHGPLPASCCGGIRSLKSAAKTTVDRRTACRCLKSIIGSVKTLKPVLVSGLPGKCGVNVGYPISARTDCSKVR